MRCCVFIYASRSAPPTLALAHAAAPHYVTLRVLFARLHTHSGSCLPCVLPLPHQLLTTPSIYGSRFQAGVSIKGPLYALMIGASSDFSTPIGYQTNLMVRLLSCRRLWQGAAQVQARVQDAELLPEGVEGRERSCVV